MVMQERAVCFDCHLEIEHSPVYEAPCGHEICPSAVFHGVCLMRYREQREAAEQAFQRWLEEHSEFDPSRRPR